ncbi:hypothetical protein KCP70_19905 [Salmonella enterica subsp. enterica]|nr:hypothetical protein KCP70_19905 [Salmonella enterica subsp. enterica]
MDDQPVWTGWRLPVKRVNVLRCIDRFTGCVHIWRWLAGIAVPEVMGSCSTDLKSGIDVGWKDGC